VKTVFTRIRHYVYFRLIKLIDVAFIQYWSGPDMSDLDYPGNPFLVFGRALGVKLISIITAVKVTRTEHGFVLVTRRKN
jgi:hypothetical protein